MALKIGPNDFTQPDFTITYGEGRLEAVLGVGRCSDKLAAGLAEVTMGNSGYEQSEDYGGKPPGPWGTIAIVALVGFLAVLAFWLH